MRARDLTKRYGSLYALDGVDFEVEEGVTGLLGSNGAGKSTALKLFLGLIRPERGEAAVIHESGVRGVDVRRHIGYMPEHDCLPEPMAASEFLTLMAEVSGLPRANARVRAADVLRHVGLFEERYRPMGTYSTGMKQRVKLAQALVHDPAVVLLDEPTSGLDPLGRHEMLDLIHTTGQRFGMSILLSSHLMGDVERTCERVIVLDAGTVLRTGPVAGFLSETAVLGIEVTAGADALARELSARGLQAERDGDRFTVSGATDDDLDAVRDAVVASGAPLYRLAHQRQQLSEIFERTPEPSE
jgi:ABC-2 type transport system ATP-binding protein